MFDILKLSWTVNQGQVYKRPQRFFHSFVRPKHRQDAIARVQSQAQKIQDMGVLFFFGGKHH